MINLFPLLDGACAASGQVLTARDAEAEEARVAIAGLTALIAEKDEVSARLL